MKPAPRVVLVVAALVLASLVLSACGPNATPIPPAPPTSLPPTSAPTSAPAVGSAGAGSLTVKGLVDKPLTLSEKDLHGMTVAAITAEQPKVGSQNFTGVRFSDLMAAASVQSAAAALVMTGSDGYSATIDLATLKGCTDCMVAFTNTPGSFLAVMPNQPGKLWVKDLVTLEFK